MGAPRKVKGGKLRGKLSGALGTPGMNSGDDTTKEREKRSQGRSVHSQRANVKKIRSGGKLTQSAGSLAGLRQRVIRSLESSSSILKKTKGSKNLVPHARQQNTGMAKNSPAPHRRA